MAVQHGIIDINPANDLQGATATRKTAHRPALPLERLPELLTRMDAYNGRQLTRMAVQLSLLVFTRSSDCVLPAGMKSTSSAHFGRSPLSASPSRA